MISKPAYRLKVIGYYLLSIIFLGIYYYMDNSKSLNEFLVRADEYRTDWGFGFYASVGIIKFVLLILGFSIPIILTAQLILKKG